MLVFSGIPAVANNPTLLGVPSYVGVPAVASKLAVDCVLQLVLTLMMAI